MIYQGTPTYYNSDFSHFGVKGMKWGVRKNYSSTSIRARLAKRSNDKVDASFKKWDENAKKKDNAISLGKRMNENRMAYEADRSNHEAKKQYKTSKKEYKKALSQNTTYRKGSVRKEVGQDISRKYLSEAKRVKKQFDADPTNRDLQKRYNDLMSKHDIERAKARKAQDVATRRMNKERAIKANMTKAIKTVAATAVVSAGLAAVNKYVAKGNVSINSAQVLDFVKKGKKILGYMY